MKIRKCPVCMGEIMVSYENEPGDIIFCRGCEQGYELRSIKPIRLTPLDFNDDYEFDENASSYF
ncbi:MAG: hypothetical protein KKD01_13225 [Proteobacteria bacterium]|nr:hypothetical protein [Pseudomonadota bacterium]MBU1233604.1 hypothetical protein [Pseudomonadota bacterium]MBU1418896.1 hypothetical protein [Pseudomonadota bacterium]MBU1455680.1 hypothetical protein [Pseudomonadota bacterium]